jgi:DNA invertase Pin-like site-specific DNA recombinase
MKQAVVYYRVSTQKQGRSGLGLEAQQASVQHFIQAYGYQVIQEYTEIRSGRRDVNRPILQEALALCRKHKATLLIAKQDRLTRSVLFIATLLAAKVSFVSVSNPNAAKVMIYLDAVMAEHERDLISERTKNALQAAKRRGVELGKHGKYVQSKINREKALAFSRLMWPIVQELRNQGFTTIRALAGEMNRLKIPTYKQGSYQWHPRTVHRLIQMQS